MRIWTPTRTTSPGHSPVIFLWKIHTRKSPSEGGGGAKSRTFPYQSIPSGHFYSEQSPPESSLQMTAERHNPWAACYSISPITIGSADTIELAGGRAGVPIFKLQGHEAAQLTLEYERSQLFGSFIIHTHIVFPFLPRCM